MSKMNWARYKFSKECDLTLQEFIRAVAEQEPSPPSIVKNLWETFLTVDQDLQEKINANKASPITDVINLSSDEEVQNQDKIVKHVDIDEEFLLPDQSFLQLTESKSRLNISVTKDLANEIQDLLETESLLSGDIIRQIETEYSQEQLKDLFTLFTSNLNSESALKLWHSIIALDRRETSSVIVYFMQYVLAQMIFDKHDSTVRNLLIEVFDAYPDEVATLLLKKIVETENSIELKKLKDNLNALSDNQKNIVLRTFQNLSAKLELHHLGAVLGLITAHTKIEYLTKLIDMMSSVSKEFASEKSFGKLLLEAIKILGGNVIHCEDQLRHIIAVHKSVFKTQIVKTFENALQDHKLFSQSLRY